MSLSAPQRDDLLHAIRQTLEFYGKRFGDMDRKFWLTALGPDVDVELAKRALLQHTRQGRYAPKPADVIDLMAAMRPRNTGPSFADNRRSDCPPEIAAAWAWFIGMVAASGVNPQLAGAIPARDIEPEVQDRYLRIVNQEAARFGHPEAIPDEYKIPEIWANAAPRRQEAFA